MKENTSLSKYSGPNVHYLQLTAAMRARERDTHTDTQLHFLVFKMDALPAKTVWAWNLHYTVVDWDLGIYGVSMPGGMLLDTQTDMQTLHRKYPGRPILSSNPVCRCELSVIVTVLLFILTCRLWLERSDYWWICNQWSYNCIRIWNVREYVLSSRTKELRKSEPLINLLIKAWIRSKPGLMLIST